MAWFAALRDTARTGLSFDRALSDPRRALRGAFAAALVVFPVLALFGPGPATSAAMGAFIAGTATFQRSFRPRTSLAIETTRAGARLVMRAVADLEKAVRPRGRP